MKTDLVGRVDYRHVISRLFFIRNPWGNIAQKQSRFLLNVWDNVLAKFGGANIGDSLPASPVNIICILTYRRTALSALLAKFSIMYSMVNVK